MYLLSVITSLALHSWFFNEIHLVKTDIVDIKASTSTFLLDQTFFIQYHFFHQVSVNVIYCFYATNYNILYGKVINIAKQSTLLCICYVLKSADTFPKVNIVLLISLFPALNLSCCTPLTNK